MATLRPAQALFSCETALRELMSHAYSAEFGSAWLERVSTDRQRSRWAERAERERSRTQKGIVDVPPQGLAYSELYDLVSIADKHWGPLAPALGKKERTYPFLKRFEELRNTVAHVRPLYAFEEDIYSGIAGTIRNQVTIFVSAQDPAGDYYPRIESAWDSFGNRIDCGPVAPGSAGEIGGSASSKLVLHPGDQVNFVCVALDPQDRQLEWEMSSARGILARQVAESAQEVTFSWVVEDADVKEHSVIEFHMRCHGSKYNRANGFDQRIYFTYIVRPPL